MSADWTNNKAFKFCIKPDPNCEHCGHVETMEHLLCESEYYSELLWNRLGDVLTQLFNSTAAGLVPRLELVQTNIYIIYNISHPSVLLYIPDKATRNTLLLLIKREGYQIQKNEPSSQVHNYPPQQLEAPLDSTV